MLHGYAFAVRYPRRKDQDFICCNREYVAEQFHQAVITLKWPIEVSLVRFVGDGALNTQTTVVDVLQWMNEDFVANFVTHKDGKISWGK